MKRVYLGKGKVEGLRGGGQGDRGCGGLRGTRSRDDGMRARGRCEAEGLSMVGVRWFEGLQHGSWCRDRLCALPDERKHQSHTSI
jgi:hypothetical protein